MMKLDEELHSKIQISYNFISEHKWSLSFPFKWPLIATNQKYIKIFEQSHKESDGNRGASSRRRTMFPFWPAYGHEGL